MARFFKKKRRNAGPNKNEEKVQRAADARDRENSGDTLGENFPNVKRLKIQLQFLTVQGQVLEEKTLELNPGDTCSFQASCPGRCGTGSFDFSEAVTNVVNRRQPLAESSAPCKEPIFAGSNEICGCQLKCRMECEYLPAPERAASAQGA
ncbi:MAG TPA: hypothetical protein DEB40_11655 [Elusimicrobia bacterium]|nr:hypothetical protein [Elusimicrobiota bacterium]HBT62388.1 hypothetical protein [Elusimicrobiota bacterium]